MTDILHAHRGYLWTVGALAEAAAEVDAHLMNVFRVVSGLDEEMSKVIFYAPVATSVRADLIRRMCEHKKIDEESRKIIDRMIRKAESINRSRNDLAHAFVQTGGRSIIKRINYRNTPIKELSMEDLRKEFDTANETYCEIEELYAQLCTKLGAPYKPVC